MKFSIGVDIGGTNTRIAIINSTGKILGNRYLQTNEYRYAADFISDLKVEIQNLMKKWDFAKMLGIGIGSPGAQSKTGEIRFTANLNWSEPIEIVKELNEYFDTPIFLTNDANLFAVGEKKYGLAKELDNFIFITLGTGVGGAAYVNGQLMEGQNGQATEFGHIIIRPEGRTCGCGRKGCLETYTSAIGICRTAKQMIIEYPKSILKEQKVLTSKTIYEAALQNDDAAKETLAKTGRSLGMALTNLVACFDPQAIFLSGGVMNASFILLNPLRKSFQENLLETYEKSLPILRSSLPENDAAVLGASALTLLNQNISTLNL